jgi:uncharacterized protein YjiS (DUF1127 family)
MAGRSLESAESVQRRKSASHARFPNEYCSNLSLSAPINTPLSPFMTHFRLTKRHIPQKLAGLFHLLRLWGARSSERKALAELERFRLDDIGITDADRRAECRKWFWRP